MANVQSPLRSYLSAVLRKSTLIYTLASREVTARYKGSLFGMLWPFLLPIMMLAIYVFVFSVVFQARWAGSSGSRIEFALVLYAGLLIFSLFAECVGRAPGLVVSNVNYVKKIVFPLEILPWVSIIGALFHFLVSLIVWLLFHLICFGLPKVTTFLLPLILLPMLLWLAGVSWFLASMAVYLRDTAQVIGVLVPAVMFMSPIFYPLSALPADYVGLFKLNPLSFPIEMVRDALIWGRAPDWNAWMIYTTFSALAMVLGFLWFDKTRKGFADVL